MSRSDALTGGKPATFDRRLGVPFHPRRARQATRVDRALLFCLVFSAVGAGLGFLHYWLDERHVTHTGAFLVLSVAFTFGLTRGVLSLLPYLGLRRVPEPAAPAGVSVAALSRYSFTSAWISSCALAWRAA